MPEDVDFPLCQLLAVLPKADNYSSFNQSGLWKVLQYYLLSQNSRGVKVAEAVQDALMTGVPYVIPFLFSHSDAESMASELRALGYMVRVLDLKTGAAANAV